MNPLNFKGSMAIINAPIAGISDSPSRKIARKMGADFTVSELVSAEGTIRNGKCSLDLMRFDDSERPIGIQLFGSNPVSMADAARKAEELDPDFIDLNFGCPARKVVGKNGGSSVLRDLKLLEDIIEGVVKAVAKPVSIKIRSGWDSDSLVYLEAGKIAEGCGAKAITLHARTRAQGFSGEADWSHIARLKQSVGIAVIGNGDIFKPQDAIDMFERTGCDAVMVGRAAIGNPWIFKRIKHLVATGEHVPEPSIEERLNMALEHFDSTLDYYGYPHGMYKMRTRIAWYVKGLPDASRFREMINKEESSEKVKELIREYRDKLVSSCNVKHGASRTYFTLA